MSRCWCTATCTCGTCWSAPDGLAAGVIDWGDCCLADPALDLSLAYGAFSGSARDALLSAYGRPVDEERELRARLLALCCARRWPTTPTRRASRRCWPSPSPASPAPST